MGGCGTCAKIFLVVVNTFFTLLGLALLVLGCLIKFKRDLVTEHADKLFEAIKLNAAEFNIQDLLSYVALIFIISGAVVLVFGTLGCLGACCEWRPFLVLYGIIVLLIFFAQIAGTVLIILMRSDVDKTLKKELKYSLKEYKGDSYTNPISMAWNSIFLEFGCCGVDSGEDIQNVTSWNNTINGLTLKAPFACCKGITGSPNDYTYPTNTTCATNPDDDNSNFNKGCYEEIEKFLKLYGNILIGIGVAILVFELLCIISAFCLCRNIGEGDGKMV